MSLNDVFIEHFGTKGMRWGVRKARKTGRKIKKAAGSQAVKKQLGTSAKQKKARKQAISKGKKVVRHLLVGPNKNTLVNAFNVVKWNVPVVGAITKKVDR